jgi:hypothetical protein
MNLDEDADESALPEQIRGYDWAAVFNYCGAGHVSAALGSHAGVDPFDRADVTDVIAASDGENDGDGWILVARLRDARFAFVSAWCDYTGWGCQEGGYSIVSHDLEHLKQYGIGEPEMVRLFSGAH